jgi:hypothetical protein
VVGWDDGARETTSERGEEEERRFHDGPSAVLMVFVCFRLCVA